MLDDRFSLLTSDRADAPEHHRSLDGAIAWSVDLLDDRRRDVLRRLSVFPGRVPDQLEQRTRAFSVVVEGTPFFYPDPEACGCPDPG